MLLSRYSGEEDVVVGVAISSRPSELQKSELLIGPLTNTLPLRVQVRRESSALTFLKQVQNNWHVPRQYDYSPLRKVRAWGEVQEGAPLFESILHFDNGIENSSQNGNGSLGFRQIRIFEELRPLINLRIRWQIRAEHSDQLRLRRCG